MKNYQTCQDDLVPNFYKFPPLSTSLLPGFWFIIKCKALLDLLSSVLVRYINLNAYNRIPNTPFQAYQSHTNSSFLQSDDLILSLG